jgi:hypothetical protein
MSNFGKGSQALPAFFYPKTVITTPKLLFPEFSPARKVVFGGFFVIRRRMFWGSIIALAFFSFGLLFA